MIVLKVIRNEWKNLIRSKIAIWLLSILTALLLYTFWQATSTFNETLKHRHEAKEFMRNRFVSQGEVNPHSAVHYGHYVYKPLTLLSIIDEGTNPFTGVSLYLEGHQQNEPLYSTAQQSSSSIRFGLLRLNLILQVLFPLFILFACHNVISKEKEENTLFISLSQGLSLRSLVWSKILAYSIIWWVALLLIVSILSVILLSVTGAIAFERLTGLLLSYGIYYFIITALAVYVSARSNNSGNALLLLLAFWVITTVILPKAASNIGENSKPLISRLELERRISEGNKNGIDGHNPSNERTIKFKDSLLVKYGVDTVSKLPVNLDGLTMQADEEYHNMLYDKHLGDVQQTIRSQNNVVALSSFINPFASLRNLSMSLAGTDVYHHFDFTTQAEKYRRFIIKKMNDEQAYGGSKTGDWDWTVKGDFWNNINDFEYKQPSFSWALKNTSWEIIGMVFWVLVLIILIHFTTNKININIG